jgi:hypothetical protein
MIIMLLYLKPWLLVLELEGTRSLNGPFLSLPSLIIMDMDAVTEIACILCNMRSRSDAPMKNFQGGRLRFISYFVFYFGNGGGGGGVKCSVHNWNLELREAVYHA